MARFVNLEHGIEFEPPLFLNGVSRFALSWWENVIAIGGDIYFTHVLAVKTGNNFGFGAYNNSSLSEFNPFVRNGSAIDSQTVTYTPSQWNHFVYAFDGTQASGTARTKCWVNGVDSGTVGSVSCPATLDGMDSSATLGIGSTGSGFRASGAFAEIAIWVGLNFDTVGRIASEMGSKKRSALFFPSGLRFYAPLQTDVRDVVGALKPTSFGAPARPSLHPPVIQPRWLPPKALEVSGALVLVPFRRNWIAVAGGGGPTLITASDFASLTATEAKALLVTLARIDTASFSATEAKALLVLLARTDTASLSATEAKALLALVVRTDTASLSATEAKALLVLLARGDTASLTVSEVAAIIILTLKAASDTARLTVTESASIQIALVKTASDTASLTVTEARALLALVARADSAGVAVTESAGPIAVSLTRADGAAISATEAKAILVALARGDAASISAAEAHALLVGFGRGDLASLTTTSAAVIVSTTVGEAYLVIFTADALAAPSAMVGDALTAPSTVSGELLE